MDSEGLPPLLSLPAELIHHILTYLSPFDLVHASQTCRLLHQHTLSDQLWLPHIASNAPTACVTNSGSFASVKDLYWAFHPFWFLTRNKLWFSNQPSTGKLIIVRYDPRIDAIEGYALVAERGHHTFELWHHNHDVIIHTFHPKVQLDLNAPVLRLDRQALSSRVGDGNSLQQEIPMSVHGGSTTSAHLFSRFMLSRPWPTKLTTFGTSIWPPLILPAKERCQNASVSHYSSMGHKPSRFSEVSNSTFRIRKWMEFSSRPQGAYMRVGEDVTTWATLPEEAYTPTPEKPWRGIWCGDYAGHGCEFLAVLQPDDPLPLPEGAERTLARYRAGSVSSDGSWETAQTNLEPAPEDAAHSFSSAGPNHERESANLDPATSPSSPYRGRLEAVKLTGDPNIPRGEYTFIAPEIGDEGLIRIAQEDIFKGARIVRSVGHIAARGFREDEFIASQLILISHDTIAQYWEAFGHISFYQRVNIDQFLTV